jgi:hypothetical protein
MAKYQFREDGNRQFWIQEHQIVSDDMAPTYGFKDKWGPFYSLREAKQVLQMMKDMEAKEENSKRTRRIIPDD